MKNEEIRTIIQSGGAVILPTETVYGIFGQALNKESVENIYRLKKRPKDKAMNLNVSNLNDILFYSQNVPVFLKKVYNEFMPGPLTIILQASKNVPEWINSGLPSIGFRVPNHPETLQVISENGPLIGPSANVSGQESGKIFKEIIEAFDHQVTGIEDDQSITGLDSTILDLSGPKARILRQGAITKEEILSKVPEISFED
ncbi:threonylcarbamoyl-AMP synthase [Streptococcus gallolyticus]|uniref:L-threonylcarbamoyladenylate synthase n=1 Tax=Streptococcus hepaticus TaxID=3349163 RepID=UPI001C973EEB|nr:threonylcarbamoyl-AMP synthase [Streptococcus gallolyticus]MBY5041304.1 threonylcarbamoyl-AMP synthase [Streptococcus gallolyticus]